MAFKYDIITLIELVRMRPCIWDKSIEQFKDKILKQEAWLEIFQFLEENYMNLSSDEKKEVVLVPKAKVGDRRASKTVVLNTDEPGSRLVGADRLASKTVANMSCSESEVLCYLAIGYYAVMKKKENALKFGLKVGLKKGYKITTKWTYVRDAYFKSLKTKSGQGAKKTYVYGRHLDFLLKCYKKENTDDSLTSPKNGSLIKEDATNRDDYITPDLSTNEEIETNQSPEQKRSKKSATSNRNLDNIELQLILEELKNNKCQNSQPQRQLTDEEIFFQSFTPYIKDMSESEKIELQMDILTAIKKIKQNRLQNNYDVTSQQPSTFISPS